MSEVRRHQRQTASGKRTTVRHHTRTTGSGGGADDQPPGTWYFRNHDDGEIYAVHPDGSTHRLTGETEEATPPPNVSELRPAEPERPAEEWWAEDEPEPVRDYTLADETPNPARDVSFKVNRAPAYRPQGDYDFAGDDDERYRQRAAYVEAHPDAAALLADEQLDRDSVAADAAAQRMIAERLDEPELTERERWERDMKTDAERRGLPAYRPLGTKASWWRRG